MYMHNKHEYCFSSSPTFKYSVALIAGNYLVDIVDFHKEIHQSISFVKKCFYGVPPPLKMSLDSPHPPKNASTGPPYKTK